MAKIFFDVSGLRRYLARSSSVTGIQRMMTMIMGELLASMHKEKIGICFVKDDGRYVSLDSSEVSAEQVTDLRTLGKILSVTTVPRHGGPLSKYKGNQTKFVFHRAMADIRALIGDQKFYFRYGVTPEEWRNSRLRSTQKRSSTSQSDFWKTAKPNDTLVVLDWVGLKELPHLLEARARGLNVVCMIHDLIPLYYQSYCSASQTRTFEGYIKETTKYATRYVANSMATHRDLCSYLADNGIGTKVDTVLLAQAKIGRQQLPRGSKATSIGDLLDDRLRYLSKRPFVVCVGSRDIRKNLWQLSQVWDRLRSTRGFVIPNLVVAGSRGWANDDFEALIKSSHGLNGWISVIDDPSDAEVEFLYQNCLFTVMASFYEGWGLPIGESLAYGKTGVVSNTSSMPEVGGDMVHYCDPNSIDSMYDACLKLSSDHAYRQELEARIAQARLRSWEDVSEDLLRVVGASAADSAQR